MKHRARVRVVAMASLFALLLSGCLLPDDTQHREEGRKELVPSLLGGQSSLIERSAHGQSQVAASKMPLASAEDEQEFGFNLPHTLYRIGDWRDSTNTWAHAVEIGDVTRDGKNDVVLMTLQYGTSPMNDSVLIYAQDGNGGLSAPVAHSYVEGIPEGTRLYVPEGDISLADVDHDGFSDVVVGYGQRLLVMLSRPGGFQTSTYPIAEKFLGLPPEEYGEWIRHVAVTDLDGDGDLDVIAVNHWIGATAFYNNGNGSFAQPEAVLEFVTYATDLKIADVNLDGKNELVVLSGRRDIESRIKFWIIDFNRLPDEISYVERSWVSWYSNGIAVGDWNGDSRPDIAVSAEKNRPVEIVIFEQDLDGQLQPPRLVDTWDIPSGMLSVDLNGDGWRDLFVDHTGWDMGYYLGGAAGLSPEKLVNNGTVGGEGYGSQLIAVGDITGDGCKDVVRAEPLIGLVVYTSKNCLVSAHRTGGVLRPHLRKAG